jgi:tyrosyl-tRNA synthetase
MASPVPDVDEQLTLLLRGAERVVSREELAAKLRRGRPLRVKLGLDPSAPDIHLGHAVVLQKLRQFQDLGHEVVALIGDFTGRIGDPSGKSETRRQLTEEEVQANARTYQRQIFKILDPARTRIEFNSRWLAPLSFADVIQLAAKVTVARLLERDDFAKRFRDGRPIHLHEFFYALMQGYDSVALEADVELGGTDQTFNLAMAREIQRDYGQEPEVFMVMPILEGIDGVQKMSKSLNNYVGIDEPPDSMFGKIMSIPDTLIARYFELCTRVPMDQVRRLLAGNPRDAKARLAREIVTQFHGAEAAGAAEEEFHRIFARRELPREVPEVRLAGPPATGVDLLVALGLVASRSEARRLVVQGGVEVDGVRLDDPGAPVPVRDGSVVRAGKRRFARVRLDGSLPEGATGRTRNAAGPDADGAAGTG